MKKSIFLVLLWLLAGCGGAIATSPVKVAPLAPTTAPGSPAVSQSLPMTWSGHGLDGHILLIYYHETGDALVELDLQTGSYATIFQAPSQSKLLAAAFSPDGKQIVLGYAAPKPGEIQLGNTDLYLMTVGSKDPPQPLALRKDTDESFFGPAWSPDGKSIVYAHFFKVMINNVAAYKYAIESMDLSGKSTTLIPDSFWPSVSPDGTQIAYVYSDPTGFSNDLCIADAKGQNKKALTTPGSSPPVDAHLFSPDGKTIYFSMVNPQTQPVSSWWDNLLGVKTVSAHNVPSDWYKVPSAGGTIERVTNVNDTGMSGAASPDGSHLAIISMNGLFAVKTDGSDLVKLSDETFEGNIQWLP